MAKVLMLCHAAGDEKGGSTGGAAGDQTGREVCLWPWYAGGWDVLIRPKTSKLADKMTTIAEYIANSNLAGYDQAQRNTLYNELEKLNWDYTKLKTKCETDCSAFVSTCAKAAGSNVERVYGNCAYTGNMEELFSKSGDFKILKDKKYLNSTDYLQKGDILLRTSGHTALVLGWRENTTSQTTTIIDNGSLTKEQIIAMQAYYGTSADGQWGPNSKNAAGGLSADEAWKKYKAAVPGDTILGNGYIQRTIPLSKIARIQLYINNAKKTLDTIIKETGADFGVNGVLYNMASWTPCENVKADGIIYATQPKWSNEGFYWSKPNDFKWGYVPADAGTASNYFPGNGLINNQGQQLKVNWSADLQGSRGRTLFGLDNSGNLIIYSCLDGAAPLTPEGARAKMVSLNCVKGALNLDGGSSCGWYDKAHKRYQKPGKGTVENYVLIYFENNTPIISTPTTKPTTSKNPYPVPTRTLYKGTTGDDVKYVQYALYKGGFGRGAEQYFVDGDFGSSTQGSVKAFQRAKNLEVDGIVGPATLKELSKVI